MSIVSTLGKKRLLTISGLGMAVVICLVNVAYDNEILDHDELCLGCLIAIYIVFYSIGYGPIPWSLMPILCPRSVSEQLFKYRYNKTLILIKFFTRSKY